MDLKRAQLRKMVEEIAQNLQSSQIEMQSVVQSSWIEVLNCPPFEIMLAILPYQQKVPCYHYLLPNNIP